MISQSNCCWHLNMSLLIQRKSQNLDLINSIRGTRRTLNQATHTYVGHHKPLDFITRPWPSNEWTNGWMDGCGMDEGRTCGWSYWESFWYWRRLMFLPPFLCSHSEGCVSVRKAAPWWMFPGRHPMDVDECLHPNMDGDWNPSISSLYRFYSN